MCLGEDIPDAEARFNKLQLQESVVELFFVSKNSVDKTVKEMLLVSVILSQ